MTGESLAERTIERDKNNLVVRVEKQNTPEAEYWSGRFFDNDITEVWHVAAPLHPASPDYLYWQEIPYWEKSWQRLKLSLLTTNYFN
ncbi:hypothetical protein KCP69_11785 [Salmonella enterica subsp. enterica]|nr:hypothetical protein KCP69_11785 [Salmonella enterica subsp. enterica]